MPRLRNTPNTDADRRPMTRNKPKRTARTDASSDTESTPDEQPLPRPDTPPNKRRRQVPTTRKSGRNSVIQTGTDAAEASAPAAQEGSTLTKRKWTSSWTPSADCPSRIALFNTPLNKHPRQVSAMRRGGRNSDIQTKSSVAEASVPVTTDEGLQSKPAHRTFRICLIPCSVTKIQLRQWLKSLNWKTSDGDGQNKVLELSLTPYTTWQTATVTVLLTPQEFTRCVPGGNTEICAKFGEIESVVVIDCDFLGMTPLYASSESSVDVVAVPGLGSHAFGSWKSPRGYRMWLRDFLPADIQGLRILIYGYDSILKDSTCTNSIQHYARQLLDAVSSIRSRPNEKLRPLIFIGHSLGGLVIKKALADAKHGSEHDRTILDSCVSLFFFGVPNKGLNNDNLMSLVKGQKNAHFVNDLREGSALLQMAYCEFLQNVGPAYCRMVSFFETKDSRVIEQSSTGKWEKTGSYVRLVTQESATWATPSEALYDQVPIDEDHSTMVKFCNRADRNYISTVDRLKECVKNAPEIVRQRLEGLSESLRTEILEWISIIPYTSHHSRISDSRLEGTGEWIFAKTEYYKWRAFEGSKLLLLRGIPGAGKTYVASKVIDRLLVELGEDGTTNRLAYFYCNRAEENRRNPESILNALVQQLARTRLGIVKSVVDLYNERKEKGQRTSPLTLRETQNLFITLTDIYPQTTICLDALDEVDREIRIKLLKSLKSVIDNSKSVVKIFATSRNDPDILRQFKTFPRIEVQPDDSCEDIRKFISTRMETVIADESLLFGDVGDELKSQIHDSLSTRSRGMFQLAALHIDFLCQMDTAADVRGSLTSLPANLVNAYDAMYERIRTQPGRSSQLALNAFQWVKFSYEPLASKALLDAVTNFSQDAQINIDTILKVCQNFLIFDKNLDTFRFAHLTVEEFLENKFTAVDSHAYIVNSCLSLLCSPGPDYPETYDRTISTWQGTYRSRHMLLYSAVFWPWHVSCYEELCSNEQPALNDMMRFMSGSRFKMWLSYYRSVVHKSYWDNTEDPFWVKVKGYKDAMSEDPLFTVCVYGLSRTFLILFESRSHIEDTFVVELLLFACRVGCLEIVQYLCDKRSGAPAVNKDGRTPLHIAVVYKHQMVTQLLINKGEDIKATDNKGRTPLHTASANGHEGSARLLLDKGASIEAADNNGWTPLHIAFAYGHEGTARLLLDKGASIETIDNHGRTPLHSASYNGEHQVARLLLDKGVSIKAADNDGRTPLHFASMNQRERIALAARLLIDKGASIEATDNNGWTPLHTASANGHEGTAWLLLDKGASIETIDNHGRTPLHSASYYGEYQVARLLLDRGVSIEATDNDGRTPLHIASMIEGESIALAAQLLIDRGASIEATDNNGWTPLHIASAYGHEGIAQLLLDKGASIEATDSDRRMPLHIVSTSGHKSVTQLLLDKGASIEATDNDGWTPLHTASANGHEWIARLLLDKGAPIEATAKNGWTSLHTASAYGRKGTARLLLDKGASVKATANNGWIPLHTASAYGHEGTAQLLLDKGASVEATANTGWTPLHAASANGHEGTAQLLLDKGASIETSANNGWTPLHAASAYGHEGTARLLLDNGTDITATTIDGQTPLHLVADVMVARLLLDKGADIEANDNYRWTPLHFAAQAGREAVAQQLRDQGANIAAIDLFGRTAMHYASQNRHEAVVRLLFDQRARIEATDMYKLTPLRHNPRNPV